MPIAYVHRPLFFMNGGHLSTAFCYFAAALLLLACGGAENNREIQQINLAKLSLSEEFSYGFGIIEVGQSVEHSFTVTNTGGATATEVQSQFFTTAFNFKGGSFPGTGGTCGEELAPEESCELVVVFAPTYADSFTESLRISYFNGAEIEVTNRPTLTGTGTEP